MRIATIGAALSGNKGAASMIEALGNQASLEGWDVTVLTTYPTEDSELSEDSWRIVGLTPVRILLVEFPLALIARLLPLRLRRWVLQRSPALSAIEGSDVIADISGVSFADDRGPKFNVYNSLLTMIPLLVGTPVVKCSQAMGPFGQRSNRALAKLLLPRVSTILARGERSAQFLASLGLHNVDRAADLAFTLDASEPLEHDIASTLESLEGTGAVIMMPSAVVEGWCERRGIDHTEVFSQLVTHACDQLGVGVLLVPHAYRESGKPRRMDDARVCRTIARHVGPRPDVAVVDTDLAPAQLRATVGRADLLVTSRFHGMITGLASATPTVVVGWGHKYSEVLEQFDMEHLAVDYSALRDPGSVSALISRAWADRASIRGVLTEGLPAAQASAARNFSALVEAAAP